MKPLTLPLSIALMFLMVPIAMGRTVSHDVTPQNIDEQPFAFKVSVKNVNDEKTGPAKDFEIRVGRDKQHPGLGPLINSPGPAENGSLALTGCGKRKVETPPVTIVKSGDAVIYTFRISDRDLDRATARFTYAVPTPGDYYQFDLEDFLPPEMATPEKSTPKPAFGPVKADPAPAVPGGGLRDEHPAKSSENAVVPPIAVTPAAPASCKNPRRFRPCRIA